MPAIATSYESLGYNSPDGMQICKASNDKVAFYGNVPVAQRPYTNTVHATSAQAVSASFGATQLATLNEIINTLVGLGVWATS